mmetsp:Transcript_14580/g.12381  ORF Transcript_14580/g.12381 Transcript_14580/m.12381 type:complete len:513 (+) Transcript_14580:982-2520(+)|eukprot:CAMPEP_0114602572 /NCGR_PEP_ID=MMETSP0125-20121206/25147_1 /TAXON_ID=485358 ORGANISM="Aristerostoma sp., Strain ATCC 50986" /NCGR_SAMPLE_ID=MMETSP0125 /ASSEMBLY_ACC=CAM_ASM_000245 /LENGTH=512 /DNA_ID=CAMNT_0001812847 /DNA_START=858 /DNA_END=2396 /DNA_ORIENTATION=+
MEQEEKNLLWKYRYYLSENKQALLKFLHCVTWSREAESEKALNLLENWAKIDYEDALHLLSSFFCANDLYNRNKKPINAMLKIREYAVKILEEVSSERLTFLLLQLVQALRYEKLDESSPLLNFLVDRCVKDQKMSTIFYWHLKVEVISNIGEIGMFFQLALKNFIKTLEGENEANYNMILDQDEFKERLKVLNTKVKKAGRSAKKIEELRKLLKDPTYGSVKAHRMAIDPDTIIESPVPEKCTAFKSAMAPLLLTFNARKAEEGQMVGDKKTYKVIFKNGDDLRQDQLILQIIALMDSLLKGINIDLKLTPYRALATGKEDGYLEFVPDSKTLQDILKDNNDRLLNFFDTLAAKAINDPDSWFYRKHLNQSKEEIQDQLKLKEKKGEFYKLCQEKILENYIESCAGYCIITYILGIGDRHLENLMINNEGKLLHIDFGFILGRDPKMKPPPFKLCKQMVDVMGGNKGLLYDKFRKRCVSIYQYLRNYSKLIINLFNLMIDSGLPHVDDRGL